MIVLGADIALWVTVYLWRRDSPSFDVLAGVQANVAVIILNISIFTIFTMLRG